MDRLGYIGKSIALIVVVGLCLSFAVPAAADQLPPRKVFSATKPPAASDINYNFTLLWNAINGGKIGKDNAPSLLPKIGGDLSGGLRCIACGLVISSNNLTTAAAGLLKIETTAPEVRVTAGSGNVSRVTLESVAGSATWQVDNNSSNNFEIRGAAASQKILFDNRVQWMSGGTAYLDAQYITASTTAKLILTGMGAGKASYMTFEDTAADNDWTIGQNTTGGFIIDGPDNVSNTIIASNPVTFAAQGITYKTLAIPMGVPAVLATPDVAANSTYKKIVDIPADAQRDGTNNWKVRVVVECAAADATIATALYYQFVAAGDAAGATGPLAFDNIDCAGTEFEIVSWIAFNGPASAKKAIYLLFVNGDAATALQMATIEIQYPVTRIGNTTDN